MTEDRISKLRDLCAEYEQKKASCEAAGLKSKAADIAADGVGRKALEALPELLDELELERSESAFCKLYYNACCEEQTKLRRRAVKAEHARDELAECCEELFEIMDRLSTWLETSGTPVPEDVIAYAKECTHD